LREDALEYPPSKMEEHTIENKAVNFTQVAEPRTALDSTLTGAALGIIFGFIRWNRNKR